MESQDPYSIFDAWYAEARASEPNDSNAMALATANAAGAPSVRMVLLKGHGPDADGKGGFIFYTNMESRKGVELEENPHVALLFHWKSLRRQIRIEGPVSRVSEATADAYFASRPRDSQLGAWASDQSRPLDTSQTFEARFIEAKTRFEGQDVPRPPHWGGSIVNPTRIEFWLDREFRLHERWIFDRDGDGWRKQMLYP
ncbi:pyridoxamine 5'-phosphate oxidase [Sphingorhabdus sp.]|jgi:pyridoxamine 5'-phosphate oxidase|uniref:pyridoxamine 5'-phosphate oxidase n=1 Tax=Sphingorhabdus sp. TaxID=1902408 RepID=UPI0035B1540D|nr:pyridoxamine 5'-phosphate oxidase [Sphingomonadaceae bacterium]